MAKQVKKWITINGNHVPVYEDGSLGGVYEKIRNNGSSKEDKSDGGEEERLEVYRRQLEEVQDELDNAPKSKALRDEKAIAELEKKKAELESYIKRDSTNTYDRQHNEGKYKNDFQNKADEYREKFLTKRSDEEIEDIKKNLDKSTAIVGTTEDDHVAYKAIEDEQKRRYSDEHRSKTGPLHSMTDDQVMEAALRGDRNAVNEMSKRGLSTTKDLREYKNRREGSNSLEDHSDIQKIAEEHVKKIWNGGAANRELYDAADKWAEEHNFDKNKARDAAFAAMNKKQMAEIAKREKAEGSNTSVESKLRESLRKYNRPDADKEAYNMVEAYKKGQIEPERLKMWGITDEELKSLSQAGRKEAQSDIDSGRAKKTVIDPLGNLRKVNKKTAYEKNYGEDLPREGKSIKIGDKQVGVSKDPHAAEKIASAKKMVSNNESNLAGLRDQLKKHPNDEHTAEIKAAIKKAEGRVKDSKNTLAEREGKSINVGGKEVSVNKSKPQPISRASLVSMSSSKLKTLYKNASSEEERKRIGTELTIRGFYRKNGRWSSMGGGR